MAQSEVHHSPALLSCLHWHAQGFFGSGYFNEGNASADNNYLKRIEGKKLLSSLEKSGLLSKADKAGLTLSRVRLGRDLCIFLVALFACTLKLALFDTACLTT